MQPQTPPSFRPLARRSFGRLPRHCAPIRPTFERLRNGLPSAATTSRSLARAFARETSISFTEFRNQVRLRRSPEKLAAGQSVTAVAYDVGFSSAREFRLNVSKGDRDDTEILFQA